MKSAFGGRADSSVLAAALPLWCLARVGGVCEELGDLVQPLRRSRFKRLSPADTSQAPQRSLPG